MVIDDSYHGADRGLALSFLQSFPGLFPAADLLGRQTQHPAHFLPEEAAIAVVDGPVVCQDFHTRHFIALDKKEKKKKSLIFIVLIKSCLIISQIKGHVLEFIPFNGHFSDTFTSTLSALTICSKWKNYKLYSPCCGSPEVCIFLCCSPAQELSNQPC